MRPQLRPQLTESEVQLQMMFLNTPADGNWFPGQRPSGFFNSVGRQFSMQSATVLDHWKGIGDTSPEITPEEFLEIVGERNVAMPEGRVTVEMAQRIAGRYDREQAESAYDSNVRSTIGGFVGGMPPWLFSPEGVAGLLIPPLRATSVARAIPKAGTAVQGTQAVASRPSTYQFVRQEALAQVPASVAMGGTNLLAQQAAYGEINALEASLAFGAPVVLGGALGAIRASRANAAVRGATESTSSPPPPRRQTTTETSVPPRLANDFVEWAGIRPGDNTATAFQKITQAMQRQNIPPEMAENLVEAFARTGASRANQSLNREVRQAIRALSEAETRPVRRAPAEAAARVQELETQIADTTKRVESVSRRIAERSRAEKKAEPDAPKVLRPRVAGEPADYSREMRKLVNERNALAKTLQDLKAERNTIRLDPENALGMSAHRRNVQEALQNLADVLARQTDHPMPAEFVAEFLEVAALTGRVSPDAIRPARPRAETNETFDATTVNTQRLKHELDTDPALRALRGEEGFTEAVDAFTRVSRIIDGCPT